MKSVLLMFPILGMYIFFSVCSIIGYNYGGSENSSIYMIFMGSIFIGTLAFITYKIFIKKITITIKGIFILIIPYFMIFSFFINNLLQRNNSITIKNFILFNIFCIPAMLIGIYIAKGGIFLRLYKTIEVFMLLFSTSVVITTIKTIASGSRFSSIGGETYQFASYLAAFSFGLNLYYLIYGCEEFRYKFASYKLYKIICIMLLFFQFIAVLITGGRGGFVLIISYIVYITFTVIKERNIKNIFKYIFISIIVISIIASIIPYLQKGDSFKNSTNRVFSYISSDGFDFSETNRESVYKEAIIAIKEKPILGYGIFNWGGNNYPHNIVLEILLNGGIVYLLSFIIFIIYVLTKLLKLIKLFSKIRLILIIFMFPLIMLMFSGTYTTNSIFWFCISFICTCKVNSRKIMKRK
ncbi:O-antigen ligase family protein [Clostridium perfringens]